MGIDFRAKQAEFASYIRNPARNSPPADVSPQRMAMYRELFFNNIDSTLSGNFPVLRKILTDQQWQNLAEDFYAEHHCDTPHFSEIAEEFLAYLQSRQNPEDFPFLLELAHYEWVEMALAISKSQPQTGDEDFVQNILHREVLVSPLAWPLAYRFPVQMISPDYLPVAVEQTPTYLIVYRDQHDQVHFMQSTALTLRMLQILDEQSDISGDACLHKLIEEAQHLDPQLLFNEGLKILQEMAEKGIVIPADVF
jgi:hypothetical protein